MNRSLLEFAALVAIAVFASACAPGKIASGCRSDHEPDNRDFGGVAAIKTVPHGQSEASSHPHGDSAPDRGSKVRPQPKRPWAQNTGPSDRGALVAAESLMITTDGAAYENIDIRGDIWIDANDVTIRNFRINAAGESYGINVLDGHRGVVLEDGEIYGMSSAGILGLGYVGRRLHIHDSSGDALKAQGTATGPTVIEYSFIEKLGSGDERARGRQPDPGRLEHHLSVQQHLSPEPGNAKLSRRSLQVELCVHAAARHFELRHRAQLVERGKLHDLLPSREASPCATTFSDAKMADFWRARRTIGSSVGLATNGPEMCGKIQVSRSRSTRRGCDPMFGAPRACICNQM